MLTTILVAALLSHAPSHTTLRPAPLAHTYSIVARDSVTGELGVAVQSHYFSVGSVVPWAQSGVGAVATQSLVLPDYGPRGLELMGAGFSAREALDSLLRADSTNAGRQVAMVDARGRVATYTGKGCIPFAGDAGGAQYSCQANLMSNARIWPAMSAAFEHARGDLAERMLQALEAAQKAGGDARGRQSVALLVVRGTPSGKPWNDKLFDLRVEDSPEPLREMRRLVRLRRAYALEDDGDNFVAAGKLENASRSYAAAMAMAPEVTELQFWAAVSMASTHQVARAKPLFRRVFARERRWAQLLPRLVEPGIFPRDKALLAEILKLCPPRGPW